MKLISQKIICTQQNVWYNTIDIESMVTYAYSFLNDILSILLMNSAILKPPVVVFKIRMVY